MEIKDKKIIVFGAGVTGISSVKALSRLGSKVYLYNTNHDENYEKALVELKDFAFEEIINIEDINWDLMDYVLKSPGIRLDNEFVLLANEHMVEVVSDIELAYLIWPEAKFLAITGTNGKTTTTSLLSSILTAADVKNRVVGNIGVGLLWEILEYGIDTVYVLEISSFQLASCKSFKSNIAALTNIRPDHLDWHGGIDEYIDAKLQITRNQSDKDVIIVNADDSSSEKVRELTKAKIREVSTQKGISVGSYCLSDNIFIDGRESSIVRSDLTLVGDHNVQNMLFAIEMAVAFGIDEYNIKEGIKGFKPIEHRIEPVREIYGVKYYNDSKGTNPDSTLKAIEGFKENIILIAGGYDKKANYDILFDGKDNIKRLILIGETKHDIKASASKFGIVSVLCKDLEEAVKESYKIAVDGDVVLFSPACASWGMYKDFEERGKHFKELVNNL